MNKFDPEKYQRRSIRLKGYDYSSPGYYFVTICTHDKKCLFGNVVKGEMKFNKGKMDFSKGKIEKVVTKPKREVNVGTMPKREASVGTMPKKEVSMELKKAGYPGKIREVKNLFKGDRA